MVLWLIRSVQVVSIVLGVVACELGAIKNRDAIAMEVITAKTFFTEEFYFLNMHKR